MGDDPVDDPAACRRAARLWRRTPRITSRCVLTPPSAAAVTGAAFSRRARADSEAPLARKRARAARASVIATRRKAVAFSGPLELALPREPRVASSRAAILWQVAHGRCRSEDELYRARARRRLGAALQGRAHAARRRRGDALAAAEPRVRDAQGEGRRLRPLPRRRRQAAVDRQAARPTSRVHAYLTERDATIYLDTSGEPLFKRGWRRDADEAPLRENLAAGICRARRLDAGTPFLDPMCGSGTIAIEAALDRRRPRAGPRAHVRLPEARVVRRSDMAADPPARARPRAASARAPTIFAQRPRSARARAMPRSNAAGGRSRGWLHGRARPMCSRATRPRLRACSSPIRRTASGSTTQRALAAFYPRLGDALKQRLRRLDRVPLHRGHAGSRS